MMKKILLVAAIILAVASCSGDERTPGDACFVTIETHSDYKTVYDARYEMDGWNRIGEELEMRKNGMRR